MGFARKSWPPLRGELFIALPRELLASRGAQLRNTPPREREF